MAAHERLDPAARQRLDGRHELVAHRLLEAMAHLEHGVAGTVAAEGALGLREGVLHHDDDHVVVEERLCLRRAAPEEALVAAHERVRDLLVEAAARRAALVAWTRHRGPFPAGIIADRDGVIAPSY